MWKFVNNFKSSLTISIEFSIVHCFVTHHYAMHLRNIMASHQILLLCLPILLAVRPTQNPERLYKILFIFYLNQYRVWWWPNVSMCSQKWFRFGPVYAWIDTKATKWKICHTLLKTYHAQYPFSPRNVVINVYSVGETYDIMWEMSCGYKLNWK